MTKEIMHLSPMLFASSSKILIRKYIFALIPAVLTITFLSTNSHAETVTLHECLIEAISHNTMLKEGDLSIMAGEEEIAAASGRHLPKITLDSNYTKRQEPLAFIPAKSTSIPPHFSDEFVSWQAVMTVPVYQGGQIENGVKLADIRQTVRTDTLNMTRNEVIANTVNTYNKLLQLKKLQESSKASVDALEEQRKNVSLLYDLGRVPKVDLLKVEVQLANETQRLATINEGISASRETLAFLMGRKIISVESGLEPVDELSFTNIYCNFEQGLIEAREHRPEYLIALQGIKEADLNVKSSIGKLLPTVSALGGYLNQYGFEPKYSESTWFVGINISIPLFDRSIHADVSRDRILKNKALTRLEGMENQIRLDIRNAITSLTESKIRVETSCAAVLQAEESYRIENEKYSTGAGAMVDLLFAHAANFTAAANHTQALFDYNAAVTAYRRATGSLEDYLK